MISIKIDVTKITESRLFKGKKGTYLNCVLIPTPNSEYGDYMIVEDISKEERDQGVKGAILGNAKIFKKHTQTPNEQLSEEMDYQNKDDLPF